MTAISRPNRVWVTALGSSSMALVTPKMLPVMTLMRANASTAAKAPPARSFAQLPPMATANRMCRLLMTAQPMFSMVVPMVITAAMSPPPICTSLPRLIIRPAAGMTAMTVISTLPSFCKKSKLISPFFPGAACVVAIMFLLISFCAVLRNRCASVAQLYATRIIQLCNFYKSFLGQKYIFFFLHNSPQVSLLKTSKVCKGCGCMICANSCANH